MLLFKVLVLSFSCVVLVLGKDLDEDSALGWTLALNVGTFILSNANGDVYWRKFTLASLCGLTVIKHAENMFAECYEGKEGKISRFKCTASVMETIFATGFSVAHYKLTGAWTEHDAQNNSLPRFASEILASLKSSRDEELGKETAP